MSSSDVLGSDNFDDLIAAVDSLDIPLENSPSPSQDLAFTDDSDTSGSFVADIMFDESSSDDNDTVSSSSKHTNPFLAAAYKAKEIKEQEPEFVDSLHDLVLERLDLSKDKKDIEARIDTINESIKQILIENDTSRAAGANWKVS